MVIQTLINQLSMCCPKCLKTLKKVNKCVVVLPDYIQLQYSEELSKTELLYFYVSECSELFLGRLPHRVAWLTETMYFRLLKMPLNAQVFSLLKSYLAK